MTAMLKILCRASIARAAGAGRPALVVLLACVACLAAATSAGAESETYSTYSAIQSVPVPPASHFAGNGGGDGWAVALSETNVYNVFHHQPFIGVACHEQSNAQSCAGWPKTITETGTGAGFTSQPQPGLYLDQHTGKLYVFATRLTDDTGGVVCIDTTSTETDPFCGFTELTGKGEAPLTTNRGISGLSNPMVVDRGGEKLWYSFNFAQGTREGDKDELTCFDLTTGAACANQPYAVTLPAGTIETTNNEPDGETAVIGGETIIPMNVSGEAWVACFNTAGQESCGGKWPVKIGGNYHYGAPFPMLSAGGMTTGVCVPAVGDPCFNLEGESLSTPANMPSAIGETEEWNGPGLTIGPRVYIPHAAASDGEAVDCFDYSTGESCANFPKVLPGIVLLYTVNPDPQRPTCIWVNSDADDGTQPVQIESFDAYTGEACGGGTVRVLASQFVAPAPQCTPANYVSLQVLEPPRSSYTEGSVAFANGDGELTPGLPELTLDETGSASLNGLDLNTTTGLPQFLFALKNRPAQSAPSRSSSRGKGTTTKAVPAKAGRSPCLRLRPRRPRQHTTTTTATPAAGVLPFKAASPKACASQRDITIHIQNVHQLGLVSAVVKIDGKNAKTLRGKRLSTAINLVGLPKGTFTIEIVAHRRDGRTVKGERVYHTCVSKLPGHSYLPL